MTVKTLLDRIQYLKKNNYIKDNDEIIIFNNSLDKRGYYAYTLTDIIMPSIVVDRKKIKGISTIAIAFTKIN